MVRHAFCALQPSTGHRTPLAINPNPRQGNWDPTSTAASGVPHPVRGVLQGMVLLQVATDFGMIRVRSPFFYFCNRPGIRTPAHTSNVRTLAAGTRPVKNQRRASVILTTDGWHHTLKPYFGKSAGSWKKPLRGKLDFTRGDTPERYLGFVVAIKNRRKNNI